ncbi:MAG: LysR family transcriptional regulator, partial [Gammaproteobacteria bacterium]|nr:LysR family transcriptional regulator [Gammaproteobacteria bacterium]
PFIWFNRKSWAGRTIEQELNRRKIKVSANMEIDTLEAISSLVGAGLGVSIVPICLGARPLSRRLRSVPFGKPVFRREIGALTQAQSVVSPQLTALLKALDTRK